MGTAAYKILSDKWFEGRGVAVDVLATNPGGRRFWEKMGFGEYYVSMRNKPGGCDQPRNPGPAAMLKTRGNENRAR